MMRCCEMRREMVERKGRKRREKRDKGASDVMRCGEVRREMAEKKGRKRREKRDKGAWHEGIFGIDVCCTK